MPVIPNQYLLERIGALQTRLDDLERILTSHADDQSASLANAWESIDGLKASLSDDQGEIWRHIKNLEQRLSAYDHRRDDFHKECGKEKTLGAVEVGPHPRITDAEQIEMAGRIQHLLETASVTTTPFLANNALRIVREVLR